MINCKLGMNKAPQTLQLFWYWSYLAMYNLLGHYKTTGWDLDGVISLFSRYSIHRLFAHSNADDESMFYCIPLCHSSRLCERRMSTLTFVLTKLTLT